MSVLSDGNGGVRSGPLPPPPTSAATAPAAPLAGHGRRAALGGPSSPGDVPTRRRWGRFAGGACLALLGGLLFASLYVSAGSRVEVLVAARDIGAFEVIERDDLRVERVAAEPDVATIAGGDLDDLVGRTAAAAVPEGAVLSTGQVFEEGVEVVGPGEAIVGMQLDLDQAPRGLETGDSVLLAVDRGTGADEAALEVDGWLLEVGDRSDDTDTVDVSVVVPRTAAADVSLAAANRRISVILTRGG